MINMIQAPEIESESQWTIADARCDKCNAQANFLAEKEAMMLYFCNHHGKEHLEKLEADEWEITQKIL